jgi:hypothetical protein
MDKNHCLWPWIHMYYNSDKGVYPCCKLTGYDEYKVGETSESVERLWNSDVMKKLRVDFMNGNIPTLCKEKCFSISTPLSLHIPPDQWAKKDEYYRDTKPDGTFRKNLIVWNLAPSNLCNFKCAYCSINRSSRFYENRGILDILNHTKTTQQHYVAYDDKHKMLKTFEEELPHLEKIYFSGGESSIQEFYYDMLKLMIEKKKTDIDIEFITNLSGFTFKGESVLDLFDHFSNITIIGSFDTNGKRAEYIRYGTKWDELEINREVILNRKNLKFIMQPVVSNLSVFSLPDFHYDWYKKGFVGKDNVRYLNVDGPEESRVNNIPPALKVKVLDKYREYLEFLKDEQSTYANIMTPTVCVKKIMGLVKMPPSISNEAFKLYIAKLDIIRSIKFRDIFTEFEDTTLH